MLPQSAREHESQMRSLLDELDAARRAETDGEREARRLLADAKVHMSEAAGQHEAEVRFLKEMIGQRQKEQESQLGTLTQALERA